MSFGAHGWWYHLEAVVRLLHEGHPGISRIKALARGVVWWPGLDSQLESKVKNV